jgi:hypothetical protein
MDVSCVKCGIEFKPFKGKPGRVNECVDCADEQAVKYTGNMIYDHKTGCSIQVNTDPGLTNYIINSTKLRSKTSNLGNNGKVSYQTKGEGRCILTVGASNAKGKR